MTDADSRRISELVDPSAAGGVERASAEWMANDAHILRIRRLGMHLFRTRCCLVTFGKAVPEQNGDLPEALEVRLCRDASHVNAPVIVVSDAQSHETLYRHPAVAGGPRIRFLASYPICNESGEAVGRISLLDPAPRTGLCDGEQGMLSDLAALVERELNFRLVNAAQRDLQKKNKNLRRKSLIDPLIGTWNRGAIMRILSIEAARCDKAGKSLSLIVADLDHFKKINDCYGHPVGDAVLVKVASRLRSCIRSQEALGRYGGEEFLIVLPGSSHETALAVAERMRIAIAAQPEVIDGASLPLTISAGIASTDMFPSATTEELISRADLALYAAKDAGRNRVMNATPH